MTARWAIGHGNEGAKPTDAILADRWVGAMWPGGNASELALRLYDVIDEIAGEVIRVDMKDSSEADHADDVRQAIEMDGLEQVIGEWLLDRLAALARREAVTA